MGLRTSGSLSALYCGSQGSTTGLPMLGHQLGTKDAKGVKRGSSMVQVCHQLGTVGDNGVTDVRHVISLVLWESGEYNRVQWGNGSKIKNVLALDGFPDLYRRVSLAMACQKLKWVPLVLQGNYWDS